MNKNRFIALAKDVINLEIKALQKLRKNYSFLSGLGNKDLRETFSFLVL